MLDAYVLALAANAVIALAYLAISATIVSRVLLEDRQWRTNPLATATASIFFSCGVGHGVHLEHLLVYGRDAVGMYDWHLALWDGSTAVIGVWYWSLRGRLSALRGTGLLFQDARAQESERTSALLHELFDGVSVWSADGPQEGDPLLEALDPDDRRALARLSAEAASGEATSETVLGTSDDGSTWAVRATPLSEGRVLLAWRDVTDAMRTAAARRAAAAELAAAFDAAPVPMLLLRGGAVVRANGALAAVVGERVGTPWAELFVEEGRVEAAARLDAAASGTPCTDWEAALLLPGGAVRRVSASLAPVAGSEPAQVVAHLVDLEERKRYEERLRHVSEHDPLTGLANRRRFELELRRQCDLVARYGTTGALLMIDLDDFKDVNDTLGHAAGDQLISAVARVLQRQLRESDLVARLGGDEFAVVLPQADEQQAIEVASRICREVKRHSRALGNDASGRVSASVGVVLFGDVSATPDAMMMAADLTLYDAKEAGRDTWSLYRGVARSQPRTKSRLEWLERLRAALEEDRLVVMAQPLLDLRDGSTPLEELLLRLPDESGELVAPAQFLPTAEQTDLICDVDRWVLAYALRELAHRDGGLCVNISGRSLSDPAVVADLERLLEASPGAAGRLVLEVTETAAVANLHEAGQALRRLQARGCRIALDDFGAGFGSLAYVKHLPFDLLKIDGQFVETCLEDPVDLTVVDAVVSLARGLGKEVVAEHVGDAATLDLLRERGVTYAQGHHVARPRRLDPVLPLPRVEPDPLPAATATR